MVVWEEESRKLSAAEDYFHFFNVEFDPKVVHVNRLHILKKFGQFRDAIEKEWPADGSPEQKKEAYRRALEMAYETFLTATAQDEKLFKVFQHEAQVFNVEFHPEGTKDRD
ncbi:MAG: nitrogenase-stabilizing/protective protein NifW [Leptospirillum sp.]|jgi:nitrogenase-stabilizing/protective protein|nr:nitrogenase-stabilizing/protective protein NifW [Nitrospiraceae bacterium]